MTNTPSFGSLDSIYQFTQPADLVGRLNLNLGNSSSQSSMIQTILDVFYSDPALGALPFSVIKTTMENAMTNPDPTQLSQVKDVIDILSTQGTVNNLEVHQSNPLKPGGKTTTITNLDQVIGKEFFSGNKVVTVVLSKSPFIHPSMRSTNHVDLFINAMPPVFIHRLVPYLDVEFQVTRPAYSKTVQSPGLLRFLMGAKDVSSLSGADVQLATSRTVESNSTGKSVTYAGMEMFSAPQSLVNMDELSAGNDRYVDVLDPFRPFASLENFTINIVPAKGVFCYKTAKASIKLHDRSRVTEFAELINPRGYKDVTLWVTYGWIAPQGIAGDAYSDFINDKMLTREAYGIVNSSFTMDVAGQLNIGLELFTKGAKQLHETTIEACDDSVSSLMNEIKKLGEEITQLRKDLHLDPPDGVNADMRIYQVLDSSQSGEFPDLKPSQANELVKQLDVAVAASKKSGGSLDVSAVQKLQGKLQQYLKSSKNDTSHYAYKDQVENTVTSFVQKKFKECFSGFDPYLPTSARLSTSKGGNLASDAVNEDLVKQVQNYDNASVTSPQVKNLPKFVHKAVSLGKLFSTIVIPALVNSVGSSIAEIQVFFYAFNEQCGYLSMHSIAEFPVDMPVFMDQFKDHVISRGGEKLSLSEFMQLLINAQVLDKRAIGYGFREVYEPYNKDDHDLKLLGGKDQQLEDLNTQMVARFGGFKMPSLELFVETLKVKNVDGPNVSSVLDNINVSARDYTEGAIMRIHVYDKQLTPYKDASTIYRGDNNEFLKVYNKDSNAIVSKRYTNFTLTSGITPPPGVNLQPGTYNYYKIGQGSPTLVRDFVSATLPKFTFGANGSTIHNASLASKADPLLSTVNMMKPEKSKNKVVSHKGEGAYDLPMQVVPASLTLTTIGCPLAHMAQNYFIDFQTGTTLDNIYIVTGLSHSFAPGKYESTWTFGYADAYGKFIAAPQITKMFSDLNAQAAAVGHY